MKEAKEERSNMRKISIPMQLENGESMTIFHLEEYLRTGDEYVFSKQFTDNVTPEMEERNRRSYDNAVYLSEMKYDDEYRKKGKFFSESIKIAFDMIQAALGIPTHFELDRIINGVIES